MIDDLFIDNIYIVWNKLEVLISDLIIMMYKCLYIFILLKFILIKWNNKCEKFFRVFLCVRMIYIVELKIVKSKKIKNIDF